MGSSVAGQIRIDLLTNAAQFKAGMREAGRDGYGSFKEEAEKFDRWFNSRKSIAKREVQRKDVWQEAIAGPGGPLWNPAYYSPNIRNDVVSKELQSLRNRMQRDIRVKDMLPWGTSMRTELTREAALTAAAIGASKQTIIKKLSAATQEIASHAANASGFGGALGGVGRFAMGHPLLTGAGLAAGFMINQARERDALAREIRRESLMTGQGVENTSRLKAVGFDPGMLSQFQKSLSDQSSEQLKAFNSLKLDPEKLAAKPLIQALSEVGAAFDRNVKNPADRASVAMHLFGRGGVDVITTLTGMREKMNLLGDYEIIKPEDVQRTVAYDNAWKGAKNTLNEFSLGLAKLFGGNGLFTGFLRQLEGQKYILTGDWKGYAQASARWMQEDYNVAHADEIDKKKSAMAGLANEGERYAKAMEKAHEKIQSVKDRVFALQYGDEAAERDRFMKDLMKQGVKNTPLPRGLSMYQIRTARGQDLTNAMEEYDAATAEKKRREQDKKDEAEAKSMWERYRSPEEKYYEEVNKAEDLFRKKKINAEQLYAVERHLLEDYYRDAAGLNAKQLAKELQSPLQKYQEGKKWRDKAVADGILSPETARRADEKDLGDQKKSLGIKDPLGDYLKSLRDLDEGFRSGKLGITQKQYDDARKALRKRAVGEMASDVETVHPVAAMAAGSREVHSLMVQSMVGDPKLRAQLDANKKLEAIDKKLDALNGKTSELVKKVGE